MRPCGPSLKGYWQQYESLCLINGVVYHQLEILNAKAEPEKQLILSYSLREEFLKAIYEGVAGHLGIAKTHAHVGRRAYWFQWRRDAYIFCCRCDVIHAMSFIEVAHLLNKVNSYL